MTARYDLPRRLAAEAAGTAFLVATVVGSGIMATDLTGDTALALLANSVATAAILMVLIAGLSPVSGAHFNPAITLAFLLRREIGPAPAALYAVAQVFGGIAGTLAAHLMFGHEVFTAGIAVRTGGAQWLAEGIAAFGLAATILLAIAYRPRDVAWLVGLYIGAAYWFTASTSFANPAVAIARALTDTFSGIRPGDAPAFIAAELAGAALATFAVAWIVGNRPADPDAPAATRER